MTVRLDPAQVAAAQVRVPGWRLNGDGTAITRSWRRADFAGAFALVSRIADLAELNGHHPEIAFGWGRVTATLTTHDAGGLTGLDFALAERIDRLD